MRSLLRVRVDSLAIERPARRLLEGFALDLAAGEIVVVSGGSGTGKTLLARLLAGALPSGFEASYSLRFTEGDGASGGRPPAGFVGLVSGDPRSQIVGSTLLEDVAFGPGCFGVERGELRRRCAAALESVGLGGFESRHPETLSGGEAQRAALASVLVLEPPVLVVDEALSELDPEGRERVLALLRAHADAGRAVVLITSDAREAQGIAHRVVELAGAVESYAGSATPARNGALVSVLPRTERPGWAMDLVEVTHRYPTGGGCEDIDLQVRSGELIGVVGANGSGKTTLLRQVLGLARPQKGRVTVLGETPSARGAAALRRRLAAVPQDPDLRVCRPSLLEEMALDAELRGRSRPEAAAWAAEVLQTIGLEPWADEHPLRLSRGQRRLAAVAGACALGAEVILADEPTAGLSPAQATEAYRRLRACADKGAAVLVISHDQAGLGAEADRLVWMDAGRIVAVEDFATAQLVKAGRA